MTIVLLLITYLNNNYFIKTEFKCKNSYEILNESSNDFHRFLPLNWKLIKFKFKILFICISLFLK